MMLTTRCLERFRKLIDNSDRNKKGKEENKKANPIDEVLNNQDIMRAVDEFLGKRWLVAVEDTTTFHGPAVKPQLVRIHISSNDVVTVEEPFEVERPKDSRDLVAAHDNGTIAVIETRTGSECDYLRYIGLNGGNNNRPDEKTPIELPERAYSLYVMGTTVFVGFANSVGWVDFAALEPKYKQLVEREHMRDKSYDLFTRKDDLLIAIDDCVRPYFADSFLLSKNAGGSPKHKQGWDLPCLLNGQYVLADVCGDDLILVSTFRHRGGAGQRITRLPVAEKKPLAWLTEYRGWPRYELDENVEMETITDPDEGITDWKAMAVRGKDKGDGEILLAAGERGLLSIPATFTDSSKAASVTKFEGPVHSVRLFDDDSAWVTVEVGAPDSPSSFSKLVKVGNAGNQCNQLPGKFFTLL
jgi:hypothetical protein